MKLFFFLKHFFFYFFVEQKFEKYGRVKAVTILKGFAFVQYASPDEAEKAIEVRTKLNVAFTVME